MHLQDLDDKENEEETNVYVLLSDIGELLPIGSWSKHIVHPEQPLSFAVVLSVVSLVVVTTEGETLLGRGESLVQ